MTTMHERFNEDFIPETVKRYAGFMEWSNNRKSLITKDPLINPK